MTVFTSAYKALAHGALNWDTQLDADMATLETILQQGSWTPAFGGAGVSLGTNGTASGYFTRLGQKVIYNGRFSFGSSASWGTGLPAVTGLNQSGNMDTSTPVGHGYYTKASGGNPIPIIAFPLTASQFGFYVIGAGASLAMSTISAAPAQSDQMWFHIDGTLA